jgi:hypothetical protein
VYARLRPISCVFAVGLLLPAPSFAMDAPLSEEAVREAYFLGQHHDQSLAHFLDRYTRVLPPPETGLAISAVTFFTPYALVAQLSNQRSMGYSAQQAEQDHRNQEELVRIVIQIQFTQTYGALIPRPTGSRSGSPIGYALRPSDFWKDFQVQVLDKEKLLTPSSFLGFPIYSCDSDGGCSLSGATLQLEFPAKAFKSDSPTIQITPPEGDSVSVDFDLARVR